MILLLFEVLKLASSSSFTTFVDLRKTTSLTSNSTVYILKEETKGDYEITFGNKTVLGRLVFAGNTVTVEYLSVSGADANGEKVFKGQSQVTVNNENFALQVSTVSNSFGGSEKETEESIRTAREDFNMQLKIEQLATKIMQL